MAHIQTHDKPFACPVCNKRFKHKGNLTTHQRVHKTGLENITAKPHMQALSGEKPFVCEKCGKAFSQKGNLSTHIRDTHTNPAGVACHICGKKLKNKNSLKVHVRTHSDNLPFICNQCGKRFNQKCSLVIHQRIHTGEKPYICTCGKKFRSSSNCAAHKRSHTGEGCIPCNICGKKFGSRSRYISHSRTHTGEKPFQCQTCGKKFTEKSSRSKHMRIHSRDKPFACQYCDKKFRLKRGLNSHLRTHTNDMPFACNMCGRTYRHKVSLTKHLAKCDEKSGERAAREREREQAAASSSPGGTSPTSPTLPIPPSTEGSLSQAPPLIPRSNNNQPPRPGGPSIPLHLSGPRLPLINQSPLGNNHPTLGTNGTTGPTSPMLLSPHRRPYPDMTGIHHSMPLSRGPTDRDPTQSMNMFAPGASFVNSTLPPLPLMGKRQRPDDLSGLTPGPVLPPPTDHPRLGSVPHHHVHPPSPSTHVPSLTSDLVPPLKQRRIDLHNQNHHELHLGHDSHDRPQGLPTHSMDLPVDDDEIEPDEEDVDEEDENPETEGVSAI